MDDLDFVVANTLNQLSVFVTGLWGWVYLGELKGHVAVCSFFAGAVVLLIGAVLVADYGADTS
jgi:glucose uptake protein GlcU